MGVAAVDIVDRLEQGRASLEQGPLLRTLEQSAGERLTLIGQRPRAAVLFLVRGGLQEAWSRQEELAAELYEKLDAVSARQAGERVPANFRELDRDQPIEWIQCTNCRIKPGFGPCPRCSGVGVLLERHANSDNSYVTDCPDCEDGFAVCTVCGGTQRTVRATVRYVNIKPLDANHVVGEAVDGNLRSVLEMAYPGMTTPPDALAIDLEAGSSAYRGRVAGAQADFRGYAFGEGIGLARAFERRVQAAPNLQLYELKTFALPFVDVVVARGDREARAVLFIDSEGVLRFSML